MLKSTPRLPTPRLIVAGLSLALLGCVLGGQGESRVGDTAEPAAPIELTRAEWDWLAAHPDIRLAAYANYPPAQFLDENGKHAGLAADYCALIEEMIGVAFTEVPSRSWDTVLVQARVRDLDVLALAAETPERTAFLTFTEPYLELPAVIIARDGVDGPLAPKDLEGLRVAVPSGYAVHDYLVEAYPTLRLEPVPDTRTGLLNVSFGEVDVFISDLSAASYFIETEGIANLHIVGEAGYVYRMGFAVRSDWPELVSILEKALARITPARRDEIYNRWIHLSQEHVIAKTRFWQILLGGLAVALALLVGAFIWNRSLRRIVDQKTEQLEKELTDRRLAAEALAASERRTRLIIDTALDAVITIDNEGIVTGWNGQAEIDFGFSAAEAVGRSLAALIVPPRHREGHEAGMRRFLETGEGKVLNTRVEIAALHRDGHEFPVELSISPIRRDGTYEFSAFARNITERRRAEEELTQHRHHLEQKVAVRTAALRQAKEEADRANRTKSDFLANMSHEIRTPMTAILGYAEILREQGDLERAPAERIDAIETIRRNGDHLLHLINDILDLSKLEAGMVSIEPVACAPIRIVREVVDLMRVRAEAKGLALDLHLVEAVPETIRTDAARVRQILVNLIGNAIKFTEAGRVDVTLDLLDGESEAPRLAFRVTDTGIGMNEEQLRRIFQPFTQADTSTSRRFGGTGLGLSISRRFAELLGGDIEVTSVPGRGCTFSAMVATGSLEGIRMIDEAEAATASAARVPATPVAGARGAAGSALEGVRILVAEDTPDNQRLIRHHLEKHGAVVEIVGNGREAAERVEAALHAQAPPDLILMDIQMPEMDGFEATRRIRALGYAGAVIALTASTMSGDRDRCIEAGMSDHVAKPIDVRELLGAIFRAIGGERRGDERADRRSRGEREATPVIEVLDLDAVHRRFAEAPELLDEVIDLFLVESDRLMVAARAALSKDDHASVKAHAHGLRGCAGNFAADRVTSAAERLERLAGGGDDGDQPAIAAALDDLDRELARLRRALRTLSRA